MNFSITKVTIVAVTAISLSACDELITEMEQPTAGSASPAGAAQMADIAAHQQVLEERRERRRDRDDDNSGGGGSGGGGGGGGGWTP